VSDQSGDVGPPFLLAPNQKLLTSFPTITQGGSLKKNNARAGGDPATGRGISQKLLTSFPTITRGGSLKKNNARAGGDPATGRGISQKLLTSFPTTVYFAANATRSESSPRL